jgi:hypothetical protein
MNTMIFASMMLVFVTSLACGRQDKGKKIDADTESSAQNTPNGPASPKNDDKNAVFSADMSLSLAKMTIPSNITFSLSESELYIADESYLVLHKGGAYAKLHATDPARQIISNQSDSAVEYLARYTFVSDGWVGVNANRAEYYVRSKNIALEQQIKGDSVKIVGVSPVSLVYSQENKLLVSRVVGDQVKTLNVGIPPTPTISMGLCKRGCDLWALDGQTLSYGKYANEEILWKKTKLTLSGFNATASKTYLELEVGDDQKPKITDASLLDTQGGLWIMDKKAQDKGQGLAWPDVLSLANRYCTECHKADGFHSESTWRSKKDSIMARLGNPGDKTPMPPPGTKQAQEMTREVKESLINFLKAN